ncbi:MAG: hypothetical protein K0S44_2485 [Bacteroidetes bacterium]|jgi:spore coat polysaccharide biosynthesis protein SpsF|nr:hypothetical protein [Bacteroidota bacterium]
MKIGILIQARTGSTRLPGKIVLPFHETETLLDIIISKSKMPGYPVVLATSNNKSDEVLRSFADKHKISFFSGEENNVLQRFIAAAEANDFDVVIRVCADNPFIQVDYINSLIETFLKEEHDYISFFTKGDVPAIKTHYGFFTEMVEVKALKKIATLTTENLYLEHVTNFIYTHPESFRIKKLSFPFKEPDDKIRLTIDTKDDFRLASYLYSLYKDYKPKDLIKQVEKDPELLKVMAEQVIVNSK